MIKIEHVTKIFKDWNQEKIALSDINIKLPNEGLVFIIGKSGSGKSTLLNLIANFDKPTSGNIFFDDLDVVNLKEKKRDKYLCKHVGFIFQAYNLFEELTVKENVALGLKTSYKEIENKISLILDEVHLHGYENKKVKQLSGGEKQRVAIARALIKKPEIILCDEPCGNLDNVNSQIVSNILKRRSKQSIVVIVSHNLTDAYKYADRVITLHEGKILSDRIFDEKYVNENKDYALINDLNLLRQKDCDDIVNKINNDEIKGFYPRKEFFIDYDDSFIKDEYKIKKKKRGFGFIRSFKENFKLINSKKYKNLAFSLIGALSLSIFTACLALTDFNPNNYFLENQELVDLTDIKYVKGLKIDNVTSYTSLNRIAESDFEYIDNNYEGEYFPRYNVIFGFNSGGNLSINRQPTIARYKKFFRAESTGLVITNEEHLKKTLDVEEIEIVEKLANPKPNGVYITDYFAQSLILSSPSRYTSYKDLIKDFSNPVALNAAGAVYANNVINGVIKTNYLEKCKVVKDKIDAGAKAEDLINDKDCIQTFYYMLNSLSAIYTFNENFIEDNSFVPTTIVHNAVLVDKNTKDEIRDLDFNHISWSEKLPSNTIMIPSKKIGTFKVEQTKEEVEKYLSGLNLSFDTSRESNEYKRYDKRSYDVKVVVTENHEEYIDPQFKLLNESKITVSKDLFKIIQNDNSFPFAIHFDDDKALNINDKLNKCDLMCDNYLTNYSSSINSYLIRFRDLFRVFYSFCGALSLIILIYFATSTIKDNSYNIGVLKSLGYRGRELSLFYLCYFVFYSIITTLLFGVSYLGLSKLINVVMVGLVSKGFGLKMMEGMPPVITFSSKLFLLVTILLFLINFIFSLIYLLKLRKSKIADVIKNKE